MAARGSEMGACKTPEGARARVRAFPGAREGVTAIEYGIVAGLIAVVIIAAVNTLGQTALTQLFEKVASSM